MAVAGEPESERIYRLTILRLGKAFTHTLREWPVFSVDLRLMEFKVSSGTYHGFIRDDPSLLVMSRPFELQISDSMDCCFVKPEVCTFCVCVGGEDGIRPRSVVIVCCMIYIYIIDVHSWKNSTT